jgi:hypothetical protein
MVMASPQSQTIAAVESCIDDLVVAGTPEVPATTEVSPGHLPTPRHDLLMRVAGREPPPHKLLLPTGQNAAIDQLPGP